MRIEFEKVKELGKRPTCVECGIRMEYDTGEVAKVWQSERRTPAWYHLHCAIQMAKEIQRAVAEKVSQ